MVACKVIGGGGDGSGCFGGGGGGGGSGLLLGRGNVRKSVDAGVMVAAGTDAWSCNRGMGGDCGWVM